LQAVDDLFECVFARVLEDTVMVCILMSTTALAADNLFSLFYFPGCLLCWLLNFFDFIAQGV